MTPNKKISEREPRDSRIIIKGTLSINYSIFKKTLTERKLLNEVRKKYNENKRKIFKSYTSNSNFGIVSKDMRDIATMLKRADLIEIEIASIK